MPVPQSQEELQAMMARYRKGEASKEERAFLEQYDKLFDNEKGLSETLSETERKQWLAYLSGDMNRRLEAQTQTAPVHRVHFIRRYRWAAAAVFLFAIATTYLLINKKEQSTVVAITKPVLAPDKNRAMITIGNKVVYLDSTANGQLLAEGLIKTADGKIVYEGTEGAPVTHTASNPRGSRIMDIGLTDGTHIWLNAGSTVTYTYPFTERNVQIEGEAYFEVAKDAKHPFTVTKGETKVTVLGTHFNVKAYTEDRNIKVTLLEGSVQVNDKKGNQLLKPGQQALIAESNPNIQLVKEADTEEAMAWKNGYTSFHGATFGTVLNEIKRWYDIDVEVKGDIRTFEDYTFYADVKRNAPLSDVLKVLQDSKVRYTFDEQKKQLTILP